MKRHMIVSIDEQVFNDFRLKCIDMGKKFSVVAEDLFKEWLDEINEADINEPKEHTGNNISVNETEKQSGNI